MIISAVETQYQPVQEHNLRKVKTKTKKKNKLKQGAFTTRKS